MTAERRTREIAGAERAALRDGAAARTWFLGIIAFAVVLFLLVQARFVMISLVVAIILFSLTTDAISSIAQVRIRGARIANWLASVVAVALIATVLLAVSALIVSEINSVVTSALAYADQIQLAMAEAFAWLGPDAEAAVVSAIRSIDFGGYLRSAAGQARDLLSGTVLVILFVGFLFAERLWFSVKLEKLTGDPAQARRIEQIIGSIMRRVNRYLLVKTAVSLLTGALVYIVMRGFGLQFAEASAILTFLLNFLPNVGSIIATILVTLIASVQLDHLGTVLALFLIVTAIQFAIGNVLDPLLMGRALRVSSLAILLSLAFWGLLWGVAGMFLSVPILVAVMIVCAHVPALRPFAVLISREGLPDTDDRF